VKLYDKLYSISNCILCFL